MRATYATQRTQSVTNGYFGGYIGKRQPAGSLETQKCVDKLLTLRAKMQGRGRAAQLRASSGRLITELEMNSTFRGAVEIFNLCCNLDEKDVLKAECIITFGSVTIDGRQWMHRLEEAQETRQMKDCSITTYVPPNKKPNVRTSKSRVNDFEAYGFRPMEHPWKLLSAYEFMQHWRCEPLLVPTHYSSRGEPARTTWTNQGAQLAKGRLYLDGKVAAKPGVHYTAVQSNTNTYFLFPADTGSLCHSWVLVRRPRPVVVVIEGLGLPRSTRSSTYNAQYCSLFFRPWTLRVGDMIVPQFILLGMDSKVLQGWYAARGESVAERDSCRLKRLTRKSKPEAMSELMSWKNAWDQYVQGNIVSQSGAKLIQ